jgi:hypothetical protein
MLIFLWWNRIRQSDKHDDGQNFVAGLEKDAAFNEIFSNIYSGGSGID